MSHILNRYFEKVYCITVHDFYDRHELMKKQLDGIDFEWTLSPPAHSLVPIGCRTPTETSLAYGHVMCMWNAKLHGFKRIAILEDDAVLTATQDEMELFFNAVPNDWDFLYMSHATWNDGLWDDWKKYRESHSENVDKVRWGTGSSFIGIQSQVFDMAEEMVLKGDLPVDFSYYKVWDKRGKAYAPKKFFCDPLSMPHELLRDKFDVSKYLPPRVAHHL